MLDGGDALYRDLREGGATEAERARAAAILSAMGAMGTDAMAVGPRDLAGGLRDLKVAAIRAGVPLLSANLVNAVGAPIFDASLVVERGGLRVGIVGVSTADPRIPEARAYLGAKVSATDPVAAIERAVAALEGKADLILLLGRLGVREMRAVLAAVDLPLAFVGTSGQLPAVPQRVGRALVFDGGMRGQALLRARLRWRRPGLFRAREVRTVTSLPEGAKTPNRVRATPLLLDERVTSDRTIDEALEAVRSTEEQRARRERRAPAERRRERPSR